MLDVMAPLGPLGSDYRGPFFYIQGFAGPPLCSWEARMWTYMLKLKAQESTSTAPGWVEQLTGHRLRLWEEVGATQRYVYVDQLRHGILLHFKRNQVAFVRLYLLLPIETDETVHPTAHGKENLKSSLG